MKLIFLILFLCTSLLHLIFAYKENKQGQNLTKPLLMLTLLLFYISSAKEVQLFVVAAIIAGWFGDLFLMSENKLIMYKFGPLAFIIGHIFYILEFNKFAGFSKMPYNAILILILYVVWILLMIRIIYPKIKKLNNFKFFFFGGLFYCIVIATMSLFAYSYIWGNNNVLPFIGSLLFIISDSIIGYRTFVGKFLKCDFIIMLTYITAQFLIVYGLAI